jgi:hypothetical protein
MAPPVLPPPQQFKSVASSDQDGSVLGFFKNAVTKVQNGEKSDKQLTDFQLKVSSFLDLEFEIDFSDTL